MAQLTFNIPDDQMSRLVDAWGAGHPEAAPEGETKAQFAKQNIKRMIMVGVRNFEAQQVPEINIT
jgi:hypothetical protein